MAKALSTLPVGSLVKDINTKYYGQPIVWRIIDKNHIGYPANSVTLITDKIITLKCFDAKEPDNADFLGRAGVGNNRYRTSNIRQWLNSMGAANSWWTAQNLYDGTFDTNNKDAPPPYSTEAGFMTNLSTAFCSQILKTTLTVVKNTVTDKGGSEQVTDNLFLASCSELGVDSGISISEGSTITFFTDATSRIAYPTAEVVDNSDYNNYYFTEDKPWDWLLRSIGKEDSSTLGRYMYRSGVGADLIISYTTTCGIRPLCNIKSDTLVSDAPDANGVYYLFNQIPINQLPTTPSSITVPSAIYAGLSITISWGTSSDPENALSGYKLERQTNSGSWSQIYSGAATSYTDSIASSGVSSVAYRVKAFDTDGFESDYQTSTTRTVAANNSPIISGTNSNLGMKTEAFSQGYTVTDNDAGSIITVTEKLDGVLKRQYTASSGTEQSFEITYNDFVQLNNGQHLLDITASDEYGLSATRTYSFSRSETQIQVTLSSPIPVDTQPKGISLTVSRTIPAEATFQVLVCNNGSDTNPTWEDCTSQVKNNSIYRFTNDVKTSENWGVNVMVKIQRNESTGDCYITSIDGNIILTDDVLYCDGGCVPDNVLTKDDILNSDTVTESGFALDVRQANPNLIGTMAYKIEMLYPKIIITAPTDLDVSQVIITAISGPNIYTGTFIGQICTINIMELGTYNVVSNLYTLSPSSVIIAAPMQREILTLEKSEKLYLYKDGVFFNENISGGFTRSLADLGSASGTVTNSGGILTLSSTTKDVDCFGYRTVNKINLSNFAKVGMKVTSYADYNRYLKVLMTQNTPCQSGIWQSQLHDPFDVLAVNATATGEYLQIIDKSSVNYLDDMYLVLMLGTNTTGNTSASISEVWLEETVNLSDELNLFKAGTDSYLNWENVTSHAWPSNPGAATINNLNLILNASGSSNRRTYVEISTQYDFSKFKRLLINGASGKNVAVNFSGTTSGSHEISYTFNTAANVSIPVGANIMTIGIENGTATITGVQLLI